MKVTVQSVSGIFGKFDDIQHMILSFSSPTDMREDLVYVLYCMGA